VSSALVVSNLPPTLGQEINFDQVDFISNDQLQAALSATSATPTQVEEAVRINEAVRLRALQATFLLLAAISLLALIPSLKLPNYTPGELSAADMISEKPPQAGRNKKS
jgi:hypothetical protein